MHAQILKNMLVIYNRKVHKLDSTKKRTQDTVGSKWCVKVLIGFGEVLIHSIYNSQLTIFLKEI